MKKNSFADSLSGMRNAVALARVKIKEEENVFYVELGESIKGARIKAGMSQDSLGLIIGLSRVSVVNIEAGRQKVSFFNLIVISQVIDFDLEGYIQCLLERND